MVSALEGGRFLVIASAHALVVSPFKPRSVAAKHGVLGLVRTMAFEGAEQDICATAICPACLRTTLVEKQVVAHATAVAELAAFTARAQRPVVHRRPRLQWTKGWTAR